MKADKRKEREWQCWTLRESEIDYHASEQGISLTDGEKEEVARRFMNAMAWALNGYEEWLLETIREVQEEARVAEEKLFKSVNRRKRRGKPGSTRTSDGGKARWQR